MKTLVKSQIRHLRRTALVTAASTASLALGVMSVVVVHTISERIMDELDRSSARPGYDHVLRHRNLRDEDYFRLRRQWRQGAYPEIRGMLPVIEGFLPVRGRVVPVLGFDPLGDVRGAGAAPVESAAGVRFMTEATVLASSSLAQVGEILGGATVVGTLGGPRERIIADLPTAQELLARPGAIDAIWVRTGRAAVGPSLLDRLIPGVSAGFSRTDDDEVLDLPAFEVTPMTRWDPARQFANAIVFNLGALGLLAIFVAGFIIYQAAHANVSRRRLEVERLLALGVTRTTVRALFVLEGGVIGLLGSVTGIVLGVLLLQVLPGPMSVEVWYDLSVWALGKGFAVGILVAVASAALASRPSHRPMSSGALAGVTGVALVLGALGSHHDSGLIGAFALLLALCVLQLSAVVPVMAFLARRAGEMFGVGRIDRRLNVRAALGQAHELRIALGALSISVAVAIGMGLMVEGFRADFLSMLDQRLRDGLHLSRAADVDPDALAGLRGVSAVRSYRSGEGMLRDGAVSITSVVLDDWETSRYGFSGTTPGALISEVGATRFGIEVGDEIEIRGVGPPVVIEVVHVFQDYGRPEARVIVPQDRMEAAGLIRDRLTVLVAPDMAGAVQAAIAERFPGVTVADQFEIRALAIAVFDRTFAITQSLIVVALIVAALGLYGALVSMQARRRREFRLLFTLGYTKAELTLSSLQQSAFLGALAVAIAVPLGLAMAYVLCRVVNPRAFGWTIEFGFSFGPLLMPALLGVLAACLAGAIPAFWSARSITGQLAYEAQ